jgi:hypothetical protein
MLPQVHSSSQDIRKSIYDEGGEKCADESNALDSGNPQQKSVDGSTHFQGCIGCKSDKNNCLLYTDNYGHGAEIYLL